MSAVKTGRRVLFPSRKNINRYTLVERVKCLAQEHMSPDRFEPGPESSVLDKHEVTAPPASFYRFIGFSSGLVKMKSLVFVVRHSIKNRSNQRHF